MSVLAVAPAGYVHAAALAELAETLEHGMRRAGSDRTVVVGAHLLTELAGIPSDAIIYNTEHVMSAWIQGWIKTYPTLLREHEVWDYSAANAAALAEFLGKPVRHVPLGYVPELTRITPAARQGIDVLFYGSINARRQAILDQLREAALAVTSVFGVYGAERDALIARAKVVLNMHFYLPGQFEIVRVGYLMANRKAVVCELNSGEDVDADLLSGIVAVPYAHLVEACCYWVSEDDDRRDLEKTAFSLFAARDMIAILKQVLSDRTVSLSNNPDTWKPASLHS